MGRKLRLTVRKIKEEYEIKKSGAAVSLPVSFPRTKLAAPSLSSLETQLLTFNALPHPWTLTSSVYDEDRKVFLCCLETARQPPTLRYSITIQKDFTWLLSAFGRNVTRSCHALLSTPDVLDSVDKVVQFLFTVQHCKVCEGNSDEKFLEVAKRRDGIFKDQSGKT